MKLAAPAALSLALLLAACSDAGKPASPENAIGNKIASGVVRALAPAATGPPRKVSEARVPTVKPAKARKAKEKKKRARKPVATLAGPRKAAVRSNGVGGYSCSTIRMAGSAAAAEGYARARGITFTPAIRRAVQRCFG